jgi:hypothetical protein
MRFHKIFPALSETAVSLPARSPLGENIRVFDTWLE